MLFGFNTKKSLKINVTQSVLKKVNDSLDEKFYELYDTTYDNNNGDDYVCDCEFCRDGETDYDIYGDEEYTNYDLMYDVYDSFCDEVSWKEFTYTVLEESIDDIPSKDIAEFINEYFVETVTWQQVAGIKAAFKK